MSIVDRPRVAARPGDTADPAADERLLRSAGLVPGLTVLDVGCGTGALTRAAAAAGAHVTGCDRSEERLAIARRRARAEGLDARFRVAQAERLPFEDDRFELVVSRFLVQHLPHPESAVHEMRRVARPGGTVAVADLDAQLEALHPLPAVLAQELAAGFRLLRREGFDPRVGRRLPALLLGAGLTEVAAQVEAHQVSFGGLSPREREGWITRLAALTERLTWLAGDAGRWRRLGEELVEAMDAPDAFLYSVLVIARGRVPR